MDETGELLEPACALLPTQDDAFPTKIATACCGCIELQDDLTAASFAEMCELVITGFVSCYQLYRAIQNGGAKGCTDCCKQVWTCLWTCMEMRCARPACISTHKSAHAQWQDHRYTASTAETRCPVPVSCYLHLPTAAQKQQPLLFSQHSIMGQLRGTFPATAMYSLLCWN